MTVPQIKVAETADEVRACFAAYKDLRPHLTDPEDLVARWQRQRNESFQIAYIAGEDGQAVSAIGYRFLTTIEWGRILYIDDLTTLSAGQEHGHGATLLWHVEAVAREARCEEIHLDTGYHRADAHRLYMSHKFATTSHHMSRPVDPSAGGSA